MGKFFEIDLRIKKNFKLFSRYILRYSINKSNYLGENIGFKSELIDSNLVFQVRNNFFGSNLYFF